MREVQVSDQAKRDLIDIWEYIAADSVRAADRLIQTLATTCLRLGEIPGIGYDRSDLRPGTRSKPVRKYLIFYHFDEERVFIVRILHGARNLRAVFRKETEETYTEADEE